MKSSDAKLTTNINILTYNARLGKQILKNNINKFTITKDIQIRNTDKSLRKYKEQKRKHTQEGKKERFYSPFTLVD